MATAGRSNGDVIVAGAGPAGLAAALALGHVGLDVAIVAPTPVSARRDTRTTALFGGSVELLRNLGMWRRLEGSAAPLAGLRIVDDTGGMVRAPETLFRAAELGLDAFGWNVGNEPLIAAMAAEAARRGLRRIAAAVTGCRLAGHAIAVETTAGDHHAGLLAAADGRDSRCARAAGIGVERWSYPQSALAVQFRHSRPHHGISTELHRRAGPLTTVPLPGNASSLVWVEEPGEAARLLALGDEAFARALEDRLQGLLGTVSDIGTRAAFPLSGQSAATMGRDRVALVGEAAHVIPPIGAQGLNLGFRDAAWLAETAGAARRRGADVGGPDVLAAYERARRADVWTRSVAVDLVNRSLVADLLPLDLLRSAGMATLGVVPWLRRLVMREGIQPAGELPALLRPPPAP